MLRGEPRAAVGGGARTNGEAAAHAWTNHRRARWLGSRADTGGAIDDGGGGGWDEFLADACNVIHHMLDPRFLSESPSCDMTSSRARNPPQLKPSSFKFDAILTWLATSSATFETRVP